MAHNSSTTGEIINLIVNDFSPLILVKLKKLKSPLTFVQETTAMYREQKEMSLGLGNTNGPEWYKLRSNCIQRMLRPREVAHHLPSVDITAGLFINTVETISLNHEDHQVPGLRELVGRWSLENAGMLVFDK